MTTTLHCRPNYACSTNSTAPISVDNVIKIYHGLKPLTAPYRDKDERQIQLWKSDRHGLVASSLDLKGRLTIIPGTKILNPLNPTETPDALLKRLETSQNKNWALAFNAHSHSLTIWPHLKAAGTGDLPDENGVRIRQGIGGDVIRHLSESEVRQLIQGKCQHSDDFKAYQRADGNWGYKGRISAYKQKSPNVWHRNGNNNRIVINSQKQRVEIYRQPVREKRDALDKQWLHDNKDLEDAYKSNKISHSDYETEKAKLHQQHGDSHRRLDNYKPTKWVLPFGRDRCIDDKIRKIDALIARTNSEGERQSAERAKQRLLQGQNGGPANKAFQQTVQKERLADSYNNTHPKNPISQMGGMPRPPGGVVCGSEYIQGLFDSPESLLENEHFFFLRQQNDEPKPFTDAELKQILRELAMGVYDNEIPFFSLHFNQNYDQFPVISPRYRNTLVGRTIALLDYFMKGYLNRGEYNEAFIDQWAQNPDWETRKSEALASLIDLKDYCRTHLKGDDQLYISLRKLKAQLKSVAGEADLGEPEFDCKTSFRIIASQKSIQKNGPVFVLDPDFKVEYTLDLSENYKAAMSAYARKQGNLPPAYHQMEQACKIMCERIHDHMVKLPFCRKYFAMLSVINFFSSYFSTLKADDRIPDLPPFKLDKTQGSPSLFPYLPIEVIRTIPLSISPRQLIRKIWDQHVTHTENKALAFLKHRINNGFLLGSAIAAACELINIHLRSTGIANSELLNFFQLYRANPNAEGLEAKKQKLLTDFEAIIMQELQDQCQQQAKASEYLHLIIDRVLKADSPLREQLSVYAKELAPILFTALCEAWKNSKGPIYVPDFPELFTEDLKDLSINDLAPVCLKPELTFAEINGTQIMGGCGMELKTQTVQPSMTAVSIVKNNWTQMLELPQEQWLQVESDGEKGTLFRLPFTHVPGATVEDFQWMQTHLFTRPGLDVASIETRRKIQRAMMKGKFEKFTQLVTPHSAELSKMVDSNGKTLLHDAAQLSDTSFTKCLLDLGLSPESKDDLGYSPIHYAAMEGLLAQLPLLSGHNNNLINSKSLDGSTALTVAMQHQHVEMVRELLKQGASLFHLTEGYNTLECALHHGNSDIVKAVLEHPHISSCFSDGSEPANPLIMACELHSKEVVEKLVEKGADVNKTLKDGTAPIEVSVWRNDKATLEYLLAKNAEPTNRALELAFSQGSIEVVELLAPYAYERHFKNGFGENALHIAIRCGNKQAALWLIENTNDPSFLEACNLNQKTPFDIAASLGIREVVLELYKKGVSVDANTLSKCPYHSSLKPIFDSYQLSDNALKDCLLTAAEWGNFDLITEVLEPLGAKLERLKGPREWKPLHYFAKFDELPLLRRYITQASDEELKTLARIAEENSSTRVFSFLEALMKRKNISYNKLFEPVAAPQRNHIQNMPAANPEHQTKMTSLLKAIEDSSSSDQHLLMLYDRLPQNEAILFKINGETKIWGTPLQLILKLHKGKVDRFVKLFIQNRQLDPNVQDDEGNTLLHLLLKKGIQLTSLQGFNASIPNDKGQLPLHIAAAFSSLETFTTLLDQTNNKGINAIDIHGKTPLFYALEKENEKNLRLCLERGANVNHYDHEWSTPLLFACEWNILSGVEILLKHGANPNQVGTRYKISPLHMALLESSDEAVFALLSHGANPNQPTSDGTRPAHIAAQKGKTSVLRLFSAMEVPLNTKDDEGSQPAHMAIQTHQTEALAALLSLQRSEPEESLFLLAAQIGHPETLELLLNQHPSPKVLRSTFMAAASGDAPTAVLERLSAYLSLQSPDAICPAIAQALAKDNLSAMQWLYQKSIPVNADLRDGFTGLHLACQFGAVRCTQWLLEKNADPMLRNPLNQNALEISATNTSSEQFQVILDFMESDLDFDLNGSNIRGETLLHLAASAGNLQHTMILLMMGATLNETDVRAETPLHCAAKQGHTKVVSLLLSCGADLNATSTHGKRPLDLATHEETRSVLAKFKQLEPLKYPLHTAIQAGDHLALSLLSRWHDVDQLDTSGFSPLHLAAQTNDITFVLPLLQQGAKVDVHNKFGKTPTDLASDPAIIKMLQS